MFEAISVEHYTILKIFDTLQPMQNGHQLQGALENVFTQAIRLYLAIERLKSIILKSHA